jgi:hypothetical protein
MSPRPSRRAIALALLACLAPVVAGVGAANELPSGAETTMVIVEHDRSPAQPTVDENVTVTTTVRSLANGDDDYFVTDLRLYEERDARGEVLASNTSDDLLAPGGRVVKSVEAGFDEPGRKKHSIRLRLQTNRGNPVTIVRPVTVTVRDSHPEVAIRAGRVDRADETGLNLTVANGRNEPLRSVSMRLRGDGLTVADPERVRSVLAGGETASFAFDAVDATVGDASVDLRLGYTAPDGERRVLRRDFDLTLQPVRNPANISLTDIDFAQTESGVAIRGSASNVGGHSAQSVTVRVLEGDAVGPASGGATFFVGEVPPSDFSAFDVTADVQTNETVRIPLEVSFVADGVEATRTVQVRYDPPEPAPSSAGGGGLPLLPIALLVVVVGAAIGWRRYR